MDLLNEGTKAPDFSLKDKDGKVHSLKDIKSKFTVIYFYPKDNTSGCTIEANMFNKDLDKFRKLDATIIGISGGDEKSKTKFCMKNKLKFLLLSDTDFKTATKYNAYGQKKFMGRTYDGIFRVTYVLDKDKRIIKTYEKVKPAEHSGEVLEFLKNQ